MGHDKVKRVVGDEKFLHETSAAEKESIAMSQVYKVAFIWSHDQKYQDDDYPWAENPEWLSVSLKVKAGCTP